MVSPLVLPAVSYKRSSKRLADYGGNTWIWTSGEQAIMSQPAPIYLPPPSEKGSTSLDEVIARRRSIRDFTRQPISQWQLSQILWATQGISDNGEGYRTIPSAGATYPLEIFVVCGQNGVEGIDGGIYHYDIIHHSLTWCYEKDVKSALARAALGQEFIYEVPVDIVICAVYERTSRRYGARGERYVHMEVGHAGQNIYLQATALGLATVAVGAFYDEQVREVLQLDKQHKPLYIIPVGRPIT